MWSSLGSPDVSGSWLRECMMCGRVLVAYATIMCSGRETAFADRLAKKYRTAPWDYFLDSAGGYQAFPFDHVAMGFHEQETLPIALTLIRACVNGCITIRLDTQRS